MSRCGNNVLECQHCRWALGVLPFSPTLILKQKQFFLSQLWAHSCQIFPLLLNFYFIYLFCIFFCLGFSQSFFRGLMTIERDSSRMKKYKTVVFLHTDSYVQGYCKHTLTNPGTCLLLLFRSYISFSYALVNTSCTLIVLGSCMNYYGSGTQHPCFPSFRKTVCVFHGASVFLVYLQTWCID